MFFLMLYCRVLLCIEHNDIMIQIEEGIHRVYRKLCRKACVAQHKGQLERN